MNRTAVTALAITAWAGLAPAAGAHHSHPAFYDFCTRVTLAGRIESVEWKDPHVQIRLALDDGTAYRVEWGSPRILERQGVAAAAQKALTFGARIVVMLGAWLGSAAGLLVSGRLWFLPPCPLYRPTASCTASSGTRKVEAIRWM